MAGETQRNKVRRMEPVQGSTETAKDPWIELIDKVENMLHKDVPAGIDEWIMFVGQVFNGGITQYIQNGHSGDFKRALRFIESVRSDASREFAGKMSRINPRPDW